MRDQSQLFGLSGLYACHIGHIFHQVDAAVVQLAHSALDLRVSLVTDHDEFITFLVQLGHFDMHLADQRAGGIEDLKATRGSL